MGERAQLGHPGQSRVLAKTGPTPGTLLKKSASFSPKAGLLSIAASRSRSVLESSFWSHLMWSLMRLATGLGAEDRRLFSAAIIPSSCLRRATMACKARISPSGRGLGAGRTASAKRARINPRLPEHSPPYGRVSRAGYKSDYESKDHSDHLAPLSLGLLRASESMQ